MFGRKKETPKQRNGKGLAQYGLFDIPDVSNLNDGEGSDGDDNDSDLEAELAAITVGGGAKPKRRPKPKADPLAVDLDAMIAASMKDIGSDEELSGDEDDPDLLNELSEITGEEEETKVEPAEAPPASKTTSTTSLLESRLEMYKKAEALAKAANETSRARRFNRGIKTINDLLKQARNGKAINPDDIPPEVSVGARPDKTVAQPEPEPESKPEPVEPAETEEKPIENDIPTQPAPVSETKNEDPRISLLESRKNEYKMAALSAKKSGDKETAIRYIKLVKQFDLVINAVINGETVDLSDMPGPPGSEILDNSGKEESETQKSGEVAPAPIATAEPMGGEEGGTEEPEEVLITASSVMEALEQRLELYKSQMNAASESNNSSKARRMGRIVKQFEQAIKLHKAGKPIPIDELPTPPGYAPIPVNPPAAGASAPAIKPPVQPPPNPPPKPQTTDENEEEEGSEKPSSSPKKQPSTRKSGNKTATSHTEKQAMLLMARQKEFKTAALAAKQRGEITQAKELLRTAKGFDPLIQAALGGLPVDMNTLPIPNAARSQLEDTFAFVNEGDCTGEDNPESDVLTRLEEQLIRQLKLCLSTRDHHKAMGDVAGTNRFEHLALSVTKDLDIVRLAQRKNQPPPEFHYETKSFNVVQCCTELGDNDLEVTIVKGYNYTVPNPKEVDTYVKIEFPFPQDTPFVEYTPLVKDTNNPDYGATYTIPMQRTSRHCLRVFKRHSLKLEIYARRGFFRSDALLGTVNVKLQELETKCVLHDSFQVVDGRKPTGGKLEVKLRVRNPMLTKQVEKLTEKWLIIDN